jgi:hypothetical protein
VQVEVELGRFGHDLEPFGVGLHQPVLDPVVDHLDEVAGTRGPDVCIPTLRCQCEEDRFGDRDRLLGATDHQAVALLESPDATRRAGVDQRDPLGGQLVHQGSGLLVVGVAAVDDHIATTEEAGQGGDRRVGGLPGRHHHPGDPGGGELVGDLGEGRCRFCAERGGRVARLLGEVERNHLVPMLDEPLGHVRAHLPEADHGDLHG